MEMTLSIIKPDAVAKNVIGQIEQRFEDAGLKIVASKMLHLSVEKAHGFYAEHEGKPFFKALVEFMTSGPVVVQVLKGKSAVKKNRDLMGATNPENADENTIRKLYGISVEQNSVHGSDSNSNAKIEIDFFFSDREILD